MKSNAVGAIVLICLGALLLLNNLIPEFRITTLIYKWWPAILIVLGLNMLFRKNGSR